MELFNKDLILKTLTYESPWCASHGADGSYLGMGLLYYALVYVQKAEVAVCLCSGGEFVPRMMRQAQRDLGIAADARTILVEGNRLASWWAAPTWLDGSSFFRQTFGDIELVIATTQEAVGTHFAPQSLTINYLHIDADHSFRA